MEYGSDVAFFEELRKDGTLTPLDDLPELDLMGEWFLTTFSRLSATRTTGYSANPISFVEIKQYFDLFPSPYDIEFTLNTLQRLDSIFLDFTRKRMEQKQKAQK